MNDLNEGRAPVFQHLFLLTRQPRIFRYRSSTGWNSLRSRPLATRDISTEIERDSGRGVPPRVVSRSGSIFFFFLFFNSATDERGKEEKRNEKEREREREIGGKEGNAERVPYPERRTRGSQDQRPTKKMESTDGDAEKFEIVPKPSPCTRTKP